MFCLQNIQRRLQWSLWRDAVHIWSGGVALYAVHIGFGPSFMKWLELIYSHPTASVITKQDISCPFAVNRGTRQGCPLSPFFILDIYWTTSYQYQKNLFNK